MHRQYKNITIPETIINKASSEDYLGPNSTAYVWPLSTKPVIRVGFFKL